jgi:hypothetical protein
MTRDEVVRNLTYQQPREGDKEKYERITEAARTFALVVFDNTPPSAEQTLAIRQIEAARMRANQGIAVNGR